MFTAFQACHKRLSFCLRHAFFEEGHALLNKSQYSSICCEQSTSINYEYPNTLLHKQSAVAYICTCGVLSYVYFNEHTAAYSEHYLYIYVYDIYIHIRMACTCSMYVYMYIHIHIYIQPMGG